MNEQVICLGETPNENKDYEIKQKRVHFSLEKDSESSWSVVVLSASYFLCDRGSLIEVIVLIGNYSDIVDVLGSVSSAFLFFYFLNTEGAAKHSREAGSAHAEPRGASSSKNLPSWFMVYHLLLYSYYFYCARNTANITISVVNWVYYSLSDDR